VNALAPPVVARLSKLLPRLGSAFDGEKLATLDAIDRTLKSHKRDWHDLAAALDPKPIVFDPDPPPYASPPREPRRWARWETLRGNERVVALDAIQGLKLSDWERSFASSIAEQLRGNPYTRLTPKAGGGR
jgi:hypothetical protein